MNRKKLKENFKDWIPHLFTQISCIRLESGNGRAVDIAKGSIIVLVTAYLFYENIWMTILLFPYVVFYVREQNKIRVGNEQQKRILEFKDGMIAVSFALNAGYSVENAFREAYVELVRLYGETSETAKAFREIVRRINQNENVEDLLDAYARKTQLEDVVYFSEVFRFAKRSGGNLILIIKNTAATIREKAEVYGQIQTIISGKRMEQKIMSVIPYGIIGYLKLTSPELIEKLYGNWIGVIIMTGCLGMLVVSNYWAKRIVNIEV